MQLAATAVKFGLKLPPRDWACWEWHGDPLWMRGLLALHVAAGTGAFLLAPVALVTAKGGRAHRRWGTVYLWSMGIAGTAIPMAFFRPILFLALVAVFSFYLAFAGWRVLRLKKLASSGRAEGVDWAAAAVTAEHRCVQLLHASLVSRQRNFAERVSCL